MKLATLRIAGETRVAGVGESDGGLRYVDLAAFDAPEAAADIADVVSALGYADGFDLVAIGDGTRAGFAALRAGAVVAHPAVVARQAVFDALVPVAGLPVLPSRLRRRASQPRGRRCRRRRIRRIAC